VNEVISDREAIGPAISAGLAALDELGGKLRDRRREESEASSRTEQAVAEYDSKFDEFLASGWTTEKALAEQGHVRQRKRPGRKPRADIPSVEIPAPLTD